MILASHNSMSYLPVANWLLKPFAFMARCQSKTIEEQYAAGVRLFDIRVGYDKKGNAHFRHGLMRFKGDVEAVLQWLNSQPELVRVRLILEEYRDDGDMQQENCFTDDCRRWERTYPNLTFFGGVRKHDWEELYVFPINLERSIKHMYASMQGSKIDDLWPWLWAKLHNKKNLSEAKKTCHGKYVMIDFV